MAHFLVVGDAAVDQMYFVSEFPEPGSETAAIRSVMEPGALVEPLQPCSRASGTGRVSRPGWVAAPSPRSPCAT